MVIILGHTIRRERGRLLAGGVIDVIRPLGPEAVCGVGLPRIGQAAGAVSGQRRPGPAVDLDRQLATGQPGLGVAELPTEVDEQAAGGGLEGDGRPLPIAQDVDGQRAGVPGPVGRAELGRAVEGVGAVEGVEVAGGGVEDAAGLEGRPAAGGGREADLGQPGQVVAGVDADGEVAAAVGGWRSGSGRGCSGQR